MYEAPRWLMQDEIEAGLVLFLDPRQLELHGGDAGSGRRGRVLGRHWFACVRVGGAHALWLPLFSRSLGWRQELSHAGRSGQPVFTAGTFYYEVRQVWRVPHHAVLLAAIGCDHSMPLRRNHLRPEFLPLPWRVRLPARTA